MLLTLLKDLIGKQINRHKKAISFRTPKGGAYLSMNQD